MHEADVSNVERNFTRILDFGRRFYWGCLDAAAFVACLMIVKWRLQNDGAAVFETKSALLIASGHHW
jgi:hypothetical protein